MANESTKIKVYIDRRRFGKVVTVIEGVEKGSDPKQLAKKLKTKLAAGGTYKDEKIIIQGNHKARVKSVLVGLGFPADKIDVE
jgi:translation initiation factor 1